MFWIVFIFTIARDLKDTLVVTNCGAESIAFLKVYAVIPAATLFMLGYSQFAQTHSTKELFRIILTPFFIFYLFFGFVLYPLRSSVHPVAWVIPTQGLLSFGARLLKYWSFSLFYVVSELFGSAGIPLLFWSCANDVIRVDQVGAHMTLLSAD